MRSHAAEHRRQFRLQSIIRRAIVRAQRAEISYGLTPWQQLRPYTWDFSLDGFWVRMMLTRDAGMHSEGWFKNPEYDRCFHCSLSYYHLDKTPADQQRDISRELTALLFGENQRLLWIEGPFSKMGKKLDVYHYRLMCDANWQPIQPRKEVYSTEFTEKGWRSFSEIHGRKPDFIMEP